MTRVAILSFVLGLCALPAAAQRAVPSHPPATPPPAGAVQEVALVNGTAVTSDRVAAALNALIPQESFHRNVSPERMTALRTQAIANVIDEELAYQEGRRQGVTASPADVKTAWAQTVKQYGGPAKFEAALRQAGVSRSSVEHELSRRLVIDHTFKLAVTDRCRVSREDAEVFYRENPDRFVEPEQLHVHAITIGVDPSSNDAQWQAAKARAQEARRALDRGMPFAEAARTYSTDASKDKGGDMGFVHRGTLANPFDAAVRTVSTGSPTAVVESLYGYHIVLVSEVRPPQKKTFEQVSASLVTDLTSSQCAERRTTWLAGLREHARIEMRGDRR